MTFLTTKDLQDLIKVDKSTIYRMAEDGRIPAVKVGRQWRFPAEAVEAWLGNAPLGNGHSNGRSPRLVGLLGVDVAQTVVDFAADALGVMAVLTDMDGEPITEVARPCGLFAAVADRPGVHARCIESWARYGLAPELVPAFRRSDFGFLCARTFVRSGSELLGMVIAGGIARADWPPPPEEIRSVAATLGVEAELVAAHVDEVYRLDAAGREHVLAVLPRAGVLISNLVEDRQRHAGTLAAIADLADARSRQ
jgi:excisionase family DNA binding protein